MTLTFDVVICPVTADGHPLADPQPITLTRDNNGQWVQPELEWLTFIAAESGTLWGVSVRTPDGATVSMVPCFPHMPPGWTSSIAAGDEITLTDVTL